MAKGRQAKKESREKAERAKEREQALQTRMGARIRAAEAEAAATENRLADFMRCSYCLCVREKFFIGNMRRGGGGVEEGGQRKYLFGYD